MVKLVREVEGRKPDTLKECWRWIRGLLHDFVASKKSLSEYERVIKKFDQLVIHSYPGKASVKDYNEVVSSI